MLLSTASGLAIMPGLDCGYAHNVKWKIMIIKRQNVSYLIQNLNLRALPSGAICNFLLLSVSLFLERFRIAENLQSRIYLQTCCLFDVKLFFLLSLSNGLVSKSRKNPRLLCIDSTVGEFFCIIL